MNSLGPTERVKALIANTLDDTPLPPGMDVDSLPVAEELAAYVASVITLISADAVEIANIDRLLGTESVMVDRSRGKLIFQRDQTDAQMRSRIADVIKQVHEVGLVLDQMISE